MSPDHIILSPDMVQSITGILEKKQITITNSYKMVENHCVYLHCTTSQNLKSIQDHLQSQSAIFNIDIAVLPAENRRKKLLISDMDSTMIQQECIDELADFIGKKSEIAAITERAMQGALNFEESLISRVLLLKGLAAEKLMQCYHEKITFMHGAQELIKFMNESPQAKTILVSGGFTFFAEKIASTLGFQHYHANILNFDANQNLDGTVALPILGREAKADILNDYCNTHQIKLSECLAVGDGANDLAMLQAAGLGVAYHAKPAVAQSARVAINHCDLKALIYLQLPSL